VIYKYRNISSDVDSYIVGDKWYGCYVTWFWGPLTPLQRPPNLFLQFKKYIRTTLFTNKHVAYKYVWGDLATRGRVRIFTALNKNKGYERITEHPERS
jgi:hypothetical protein